MFHAIPHDKREWLGTLFRTLIILAIFVEVGCFFIPDLHPELDPYRFKERQKAFADWAKQKTPETKASWDAERHLLRVHQGNRGLLVLASFLFVDGVVIYFFWNYGAKKASPQHEPMAA